MSLVLNTRQVEGVLLMDMSGRLSIMNRNFREAVRLLIQAGHRHFVFEMTDISYIDSCGLGQLVSAYTTIKNAGGSMRIVAPGRRVRELLNMSKLDTVFEIREEELSRAAVDT